MFAIAPSGKTGNVCFQNCFARTGALALLLSASAAGLFAACAGGGGGSRGGALEGVECQNGQITTWGEAPVFASQAAARDKAKEDACRKAVEKCIGEEVSSASGVADGQSLLNEIYTQSKGICRRDQIVDEQTYDLDTVKMLKVFVRFEVSPAEIQRSINTAKELVGNPKVMVLIREEYNLPNKRVEGFASRQSKSASLLRDFLAQRGYTVLDPGPVARAIANEAFFAENPGELTDEIKDRAADAGADILIVGRVEANPQDISALAGSDFKSFRATGAVSIQTLWGYGRLLGEYSESAPGAHVTALTAAQKSVEAFTTGRDRGRVSGLAAFVDRRLQEEWATITRNNQIKVTIQGLDQAEAGLFRDNLLESTAVKKVNEIEFSQDQIVWDVYYPGRAFALGDTLGFHSDNPAVFSVLKRNCKKIRVQNVRRGEMNLLFTGGGC